MGADVSPEERLDRIRAQLAVYQAQLADAKTQASRDTLMRWINRLLDQYMEVSKKNKVV